MLAYKTAFAFLGLVLSLSPANAVTIINWSATGCAGVAYVCRNLGQIQCCGRGAPHFSSSFSGMINSEIGAVCNLSGADRCGTIRAAQAGRPGLCINKPGALALTGAYWFSCVNTRGNTCPAKIKRGIDAAAAALAVRAQMTAEPADPDAVIVGDHMFELNADGEPQADIDALHALVRNGTASYESIPQELLQWEVPMDMS